MNKKSVFIVTLLLLSCVVFAFKTPLGEAKPKTWYVNDDGGADFNTIGEAIFAAKDGDTIFVYNGTYHEHLMITGRQKLTLIGESKYGTIIDGSGWGYTVKFLGVDAETICNFTIRNAETCLFLEDSRNVNISANIFSTDIVGDPYNWGGGISLLHSDNNTIANNLILNVTEVGIFHDSSSYNVEVGNTIVQTDQVTLQNAIGVFMGDNCAGNRVAGNTIHRSMVGIYAGQLASNNIFEDNLISGLFNYECGINVWGPDNRIADNVISGMSYVAIQLNSVSSDGLYGLPNACRDNLVVDNIVSDSVFGINLILSAFSNTISRNKVMNNTIGILIADSNNNTVSGNVLSINDEALLILSSNNTRVYHNSFINNSVQTAYSDSIGTAWDNGYPSGGNYWSDYTGVDANMDGIGDTPYIVDWDNVDHYPFVDSRCTHPCDINGDGRIDIADVAVVSRAFGSYPSHKMWNPLCDINKDSRVDIRDVASVCGRFGWYKPPE